MGGALGILEAFVDFALRDLGDRRARRSTARWRSIRRSRTGTSNHILDETIAPARITPRRSPCRPRRSPRHIAEALDLVGLLAVEMFVDPATATCWSTSWRRGRTIPATGRSTPASPASSSSSCARSAACRWARPERHSDAVMKNLIGDDVERLARDPRRARRQAASLRQGRGPARPQDGPCDAADREEQLSQSLLVATFDSLHIDRSLASASWPTGLAYARFPSASSRCLAERPPGHQGLAWRQRRGSTMPAPTRGPSSRAWK